MNPKSFLLCEKYAPDNLEEMILPSVTKSQLNGYLETKNLPNLLLSGPPGIGKTQSIKIICDSLGFEYILVNGSNEGGRSLDFIRNRVQKFITTKSLVSSERKVIIFDEFDNSTRDVQMLLRSFIEQHQEKCSFCFTCNYINRIDDAIVSRTTPVSFLVPPTEKKHLILGFYKRLESILKAEGVKYNQEVLVNLIIQNFGNWRRILNICQSYLGTESEIDVGILGTLTEASMNNLFSFIKKKKYDSVRQWVVKHISNNPHEIIKSLYDHLENNLDNSSIPVAVLLLAKYDANVSLDTIPEIQLLACLTEIMGSCSFKD